jgi:hypothetical protein
LASEEIELSTRNNFVYRLALGAIYRGWARSASGNTTEGIPNASGRTAIWSRHQRPPDRLFHQQNRDSRRRAKLTLKLPRQAWEKAGESEKRALPLPFPPEKPIHPGIRYLAIHNAIFSQRAFLLNLNANRVGVGKDTCPMCISLAWCRFFDSFGLPIST